MARRLNRRQRRAAGVEIQSLTGWAAALPDAPVRRCEIAPILDAAFDAAFREYHDRQRPIRRVARFLGRWLGRPLYTRWRRWRGRRT